VYFGKFVKREVVIREKQAFARKFPKREYRPREPISISCSDRVCTVNGIVDFRAIDPIGKILSEGVATFEYRLVVTGPALKISLENGSVLSRNRTSLSPVSSYERDGAPVSPVSERHGNRRAAWQRTSCWLGSPLRVWTFATAKIASGAGPARGFRNV
jgi:hypothetical protein